MNLFPQALTDHAQLVLESARVRGLTLATVESCTGGLLSAMLTELPGASDMFTHGFITYANEAKYEMVGVDAALIQHHGAVSEAVARAMAEGALRAAGADISISITGIAGPGGGSVNKPVGTVHFACAMKGKPTIHSHRIFAGDRSEIRLSAVDHALDLIIAELKNQV